MQSRARIITALVAAGLLAPVVGAQTATPQGQSTSAGQSQSTQSGNSGTANRDQNTSTGSQQDQSTPGTSGQGSNAGAERRTGSQQDQSTRTTGSSDQGSNAGQTGAKISGSDRKFMMEAAVGGMKEVELGRLAAQKATNPELKQFAEKMVEEHSKVNDELKSLAAAKGVTLPSAPDARLQSTLTKMQNLSGAEFDRAYLKEAGVKEHEKAEKLFRDQSSRGKDPEARAFAAKVLPAVQHHLTEARGLESSVSGTRMSSGTSTSGSGSSSSSGSTSGSGTSSSGTSSGTGTSTGTSNPSGQGSNTSTRPQ